MLRAMRLTETDPAEAAILTLLEARGGAKTICPSEAARLLAGNPKDESWRKFLAPVRRAAGRLAAAERIEILHKGKKVEPAQARGVLRLRLLPQ
jgi:hypothetical protein